MDPENSQLPPLESLPILTEQMIAKLQAQGRFLLKFDELVIDATQFDHPGNNSLLKKHTTHNINEIFFKKGHSENAQLLLCKLTVGRTHEPSEPSKGSILYNQIRDSERTIMHELALEKIDFSLALLPQLDKLDVDQLEVITEIPKFFQNPSKIIFKEGALENWWFTTHFWHSNLSFQMILVFLSYFLYLQNAEILPNIGYLVYGLMKWTLVQYYFHRFLLHYDLRTNPTLRGHYLHHAFPNHKGKIALSFLRNVVYLVSFFVIYSIFISRVKALLILLGVVIGFTVYDAVHYYCHFGPQQTCWLLDKLRSNHLKHHYRDQNRGFGVTSPLWDFVFRTSHVKVE